MTFNASSKFNTNANKRREPKYSIGDVIGNYKITRYDGFHDDHGNHVRPEHVYEVECLHCGHVQLKRQNSMRKIGKRCIKCKINHKPKLKPTKQWATDDEALQIARACKW